MTVLSGARAYFKAPDAQPITAPDAALKFGTTLSYMRGILTLLRYEGVVRFERKADRASGRALYYPASEGLL